MMSDDAVNITGTHPSSYSKGDVFVISGLINPTLVVPKGATVQFTIINLDEDMYHNLAIHVACKSTIMTYGFDVYSITLIR
jgi:FtsP/CotA-like multicopper oxidase with cupredoxin domain